MSKVKTPKQPVAAVTEAPTTNGEAKKTKCPISRDRFHSKAPRALSVVIAGQPVAAEIKEFSTGSFGWFTQGKISLEVDGVVVKVQVGLNLIVVGSKEA